MYLDSFCVLWAAPSSSFFFFNDTATTEIYTLSLHDALPISTASVMKASTMLPMAAAQPLFRRAHRSEEHTSELQSPDHLVCRLLLEKKKNARLLAPTTLDFTRSASTCSQQT